MPSRNKKVPKRTAFWAGMTGGVLMLGAVSSAQAHFQMLIPSDDMVKQQESRILDLDIKFWHPFEGFGMNMVAPAQFGVMLNGSKKDLRTSLKLAKFTDSRGKKFSGFVSSYAIRRPGDYTFYIEPKPYWEASEDKYIIHYTKVVVDAFGLEEGWDQEVGLKTEIVPLTRPYGLYTGNVFQGIVKLDGKPAPFTMVEVEYYNKDGKLHAEADPLITQRVKADANGVFTYAMPRAGWWTFAALTTKEKAMEHEGRKVDVELGALLWVKTHDMQ